jgi:hypothetical protein
MANQVINVAAKVDLLRDQLSERPDTRTKLMTKLAPDYVVLAASDDVTDFCDWRQFDQWRDSR